jgi:murein DD-endopeptidase MepM/ murein hydrolase activator NlpD
LTLKKIPVYVLKIAAVATFALLYSITSAAAEKWSVLIWEGDVNQISRFEIFCKEKGLTSAEVLEVNGYFGGELPAKGEELLVPESKSHLLATWIEAQSRKGGPKPLVTVKLHSTPTKLRESAPDTAAAPKPTPPVPSPEPPGAKTETGPGESAGSMRIVVSGDGIVLQPAPKDQTPESALIDPAPSKPIPAVVERDIIIPRPETLTPRKVTPPPDTQGKMTWPASGKVSSGFGARRGRRRVHSGIDIPMPSGTPIVAARDGVVQVIATSKDRRYRGYGNTVVIDHGGGIATWYAHCSKINVKKGQKVKQGDVVAFVGNTGRTTTHHVHFEVRKNGSAVNPIPYLASR